MLWEVWGCDHECLELLSLLADCLLIILTLFRFQYCFLGKESKKELYIPS